MHRAALLFLLTSLLVVAPACGGSKADGPDAAAVTPALEAWERADTGAFEHVTRYTESDDGPKQVISGEYELSTNRAAFSQEISGVREDAALLEYVITDGLIFMNAREWPAAIRGCWLVVDDAALAQTGLAASAEDSLPANLQSLRTLEEADGNATVDLLSAAQMLLGARFLSTLDLTALDGRVPVEVELDDGRIRSWRLRGGHVAETMQSAGVDLGAEEAEGLRAMVSDVSYSDVGEPVEVTPPPERVRMTGAEMEAEECGAR